MSEPKPWPIFDDGYPMPSDWFADFDLIRKLDGGNQAHVFYAVYAETQPCVLKVYKAWQHESLRTSESELGEVLRSWKAKSTSASGERERRIVRLLDFGEYSQMVGAARKYIWYEHQEYIEGGTLSDLVGKDRRLPAELIVPLVEQLSRAISYTQSEIMDGGADRTLAHKDVKPDNILVRRRPEIEGGLELALGDFGIARRLRTTGSSGLTDARHTPRYAAPEQLRGQTTAAIDWWAMGIIVAEAVFGEHPWLIPDTSSAEAGEDYDTGSEQDVAQMVQIRSFGDLKLSVEDPRLDQLLRGLLHREYKKRWMADEVEQWLLGKASDPPVDNFNSAYEISIRLPAFLILGVELESPREIAEDLQARWQVVLDDYLDSSGQYFDLLVEWFQRHRLNDGVIALESTGHPLGRLARLGALYSPDRPVFKPGYEDDSSGELTRENLIAVADSVERNRLHSLTALTDEDDEDLGETAAEQWFRELYAHQVLRIWGDTERPELKELRNIDEVWRQVFAVFEQLRPAEWRSFAGPSAVRGDGYFLAVIMLALLSDEHRDDLRASAEDARADEQAMSQDWFRLLAGKFYGNQLDIACELLLVEGRSLAAQEAFDRELAMRGIGSRAKLLMSRATGNRVFRTLRYGVPLIGRFTVDRPLVRRGENVTVRWRVHNAEIVVLGSTAVAATGGVKLAPTDDCELTLRAISASGVTVTRTIDIQVHGPLRDGKAWVDQTSIAQGQPVTVTWSIPGATRVTVQGIGSGTASGSVVDTPDQSRVYQVVGENDFGRFEIWTEPVYVFAANPIHPIIASIPDTDLPVRVPLVLLPDLGPALAPETSGWGLPGHSDDRSIAVPPLPSVDQLLGSYPIELPESTLEVSPTTDDDRRRGERRDRR